MYILCADVTCIYIKAQERLGKLRLEALRATAKGEDDEWDEQDDEALVGEEQLPPKKGVPPEKRGELPQTK